MKWTQTNEHAARLQKKLYDMGCLYGLKLISWNLEDSLISNFNWNSVTKVPFIADKTRQKAERVQYPTNYSDGHMLSNLE